MKVRDDRAGQPAGDSGFPSASQLAALRAWYAGLPARAAVMQYLGQNKATGQASRAMMGDIRRQLASYAKVRHRDDLLADLTVRVPRRRRWWAAVPGLGSVSVRRVEETFAAHPTLTERAWALVIVPRTETSPWEHLVVPHEVDGSKGAFRAPQATCMLSASNDYEAVQAWLGLQDSTATQRAYRRKEAERLVLWPFSSAARRCRR